MTILDINSEREQNLRAKKGVLNGYPNFEVLYMLRYLREKGSRHSSSNESIDIGSWLNFYPSRDAIYFISKDKSFGNREDSESQYDKQFAVDLEYIKSVQRGIEVILGNTPQVDTSGPALEIGCGSGILSTALLRNNSYKSYLITDSSHRFLKMTRTKINDYRINNDSMSLAVLNAEDITKLPREAFSLVALRYVLHHILDWRQFLSNAASLLKTGGILILEEPCREGMILQGLLMQMLPIILKAKNKRLPEEIKKDINFFTDTIKWYLRTDVDKSKSEDKHCFKVEEIITKCNDSKMKVTFYPNSGLNELAHQTEDASQLFIQEFRHNLRGNFGFNDELLELFEENIVSNLKFIQDISCNNCSPVCRGVFVAQKT